jgi:DNA-binding PadR family transcriptional regulator
VVSVKLGLLALLDEQPMYGYQLHTAFKERTGNTWPLNIGQVYTTLARLDRAGLVEATGTDAEGRQRYALTAAGRAELTGWFASPVARADRPRDELAIKMAVALTVSGVDVRDVIQTQRTATLRDLQELTRQKLQTPDDDVAGLLALDSLVFQAEAEVRWLDSCEERLVRRTAKRNLTRSARDSTRNRGRR